MGFETCDSNSRVSDCWCMAGWGVAGKGFGFRVSGDAFRISSFVFRVSSFGFRGLGIGYRASGFGYRVPCPSWGAGTGCRSSPRRSPTPSVQKSGSVRVCEAIFFLFFINLKPLKKRSTTKYAPFAFNM